MPQAELAVAHLRRPRPPPPPHGRTVLHYPTPLTRRPLPSHTPPLLPLPPLPLAPSLRGDSPSFHNAAAAAAHYHSPLANPIQPHPPSSPGGTSSTSSGSNTFPPAISTSHLLLNRPPTPAASVTHTETDGAIRMYLSCLSNMFSLLVAVCHNLDAQALWPEIVRLKNTHVLVKNDLKGFSRFLRSGAPTHAMRPSLLATLDSLERQALSIWDSLLIVLKAPAASEKVPPPNNLESFAKLAREVALDLASAPSTSLETCLRVTSNLLFSCDAIYVSFNILRRILFRKERSAVGGADLFVFASEEAVRASLKLALAVAKGSSQKSAKRSGGSNQLVAAVQSAKTEWKDGMRTLSTIIEDMSSALLEESQTAYASEPVPPAPISRETSRGPLSRSTFSLRTRTGESTEPALSTPDYPSQPTSGTPFIPARSTSTTAGASTISPPHSPLLTPPVPPARRSSTVQELAKKYQMTTIPLPLRHNPDAHLLQRSQSTSSSSGNRSPSVYASSLSSPLVLPEIPSLGSLFDDGLLTPSPIGAPLAVAYAHPPRGSSTTTDTLPLPPKDPPALTRSDSATTPNASPSASASSLSGSGDRLPDSRGSPTQSQPVSSAPSPSQPASPALQPLFAPAVNGTRTGTVAPVPISKTPSHSGGGFAPHAHSALIAPPVTAPLRTPTPSISRNSTPFSPSPSRLTRRSSFDSIATISTIPAADVNLARAWKAALVHLLSIGADGSEASNRAKRPRNPSPTGSSVSSAAGSVVSAASRHGLSSASPALSSLSSTASSVIAGAWDEPHRESSPHSPFSSPPPEHSSTASPPPHPLATHRPAVRLRTRNLAKALNAYFALVIDSSAAVDEVALHKASDEIARRLGVVAEAVRVACVDCEEALGLGDEGQSWREKVDSEGATVRDAFQAILAGGSPSAATPSAAAAIATAVASSPPASVSGASDAAEKGGQESGIIALCFAAVEKLGGLIAAVDGMISAVERSASNADDHASVAPGSDLEEVSTTVGRSVAAESNDLRSSLDSDLAFHSSGISAKRAQRPLVDVAEVGEIVYEPEAAIAGSLANLTSSTLLPSSDGQAVKYATPKKLVERLTNHRIKDPTLQQVLLTTLHTFISPAQFIRLLCDRLTELAPLIDDLDQFQSVSIPTRVIILHFVTERLRLVPAEFRDHPEVLDALDDLLTLANAFPAGSGRRHQTMWNMLQNFLGGLTATLAIARDHNVMRIPDESKMQAPGTPASTPVIASSSLSAISSMVSGGPKMTHEAFSFSGATLPLILPFSTTTALPLTILNVDPLAIAQHMLVVDREVYLTITVADLLKSASPSSAPNSRRPTLLPTVDDDDDDNSVVSNSTVTPSSKKKGSASSSTSKPKGVAAMVERFNFLSKLVTTAVMGCSTPQARADVIVHFVRVAKHCLDIRNLNGAHSIATSLASAALHRLTKTWVKVPRTTRATLTHLQQLFSPSANFSHLRAFLRTLQPHSPATHPRDAYTVPWLGLHTRDIVQIEEVLPRFADRDGLLVHFGRCRHLQACVDAALRFQAVPTAAPEGWRMYPKIRRLLVADEGLLSSPSQQFKMSLELEPRGKG
ncbi:hypothetical protein DFJ73DRAFT_957887 [Zopfochytrium polystomum]|nr:hypothetical protein DFJ73DRAFT_957887 [Zopfochytrium polystomum]